MSWNLNSSPIFVFDHAAKGSYSGTSERRKVSFQSPANCEWCFRYVSARTDIPNLVFLSQISPIFFAKFQEFNFFFPTKIDILAGVNRMSELAQRDSEAIRSMIWIICENSLTEDTDSSHRGTQTLVSTGRVRWATNLPKVILKFNFHWPHFLKSFRPKRFKKFYYFIILEVYFTGIDVFRIRYKFNSQL